MSKANKNVAWITGLLLLALVLTGIMLSTNPSAVGVTPVKAQREPWPLKRMYLVEKDDVQCMVYAFGNAGGISCNWDEYNEQKR